MEGAQIARSPARIQYLAWQHSMLFHMRDNRGRQGVQRYRLPDLTDTERMKARRARLPSINIG